jgi:ABC-type glycerol-3-phosphate transport system permease component
MAGGLIIGLPVAILYGVVFDHFIRGLTGADTS